MNATNIAVTLHEHIDIAASAYFHGYQATISIASTNRYGSDNRCRYDVVEITIPEEAGGPIASARDLIRPTPDSALALVVAIITIRHGQRETCLLQVQFFRAVQRVRQQRWLANNVLARFPLVHYGVPHPQWIALYPLVTLRAPALKIDDPYQSNHYMLYCAQYLSRGLWEDIPSQQTRLAWHLGLPRLDPTVEANDADSVVDEL